MQFLNFNLFIIMDEKFNLFKNEKSTLMQKTKEDYLDIALTTGTAQNMNNATGSLDFDIGSTDAYLDLPEAVIIAFMKVIVAADINIALENNFFPKMFSQIVLLLNGNSFQTADFPDVIDTILKYITLPNDYAETEGCITGWFPDTHSGGFVNILPNNAKIEQIAARVNLEKVNTDFQERNTSHLMLVLLLLVKINLQLNFP